MVSLKARVAYLQGLTAGLEMPAEAKETKLLVGIVDTLDEFADAVEELDAAQERTEGYLESVDEDLHGLESDIYSEEDDPNGDVQCLELDDSEHLEPSSLNNHFGGEVSPAGGSHFEGGTTHVRE
jgi:hypothetical protein